MFYTVYKITNKLNNKIYVGSHQTSNLEDGYMGSGKHLKRAQQKYGMSNFEKEILFICESREEMYEKEAEIVNELFVASSSTYNLTLGGKGGWHHENSDPDKQRSKGIRGNASMRELIKTSVEFREMRKRVGSKNMTAAHKAGKIRYDTFTGKTHTEEAKQRIGAAASLRQSGSLNVNYNKMWITNGVDSKMIPKDQTIPEGWYKGKVQKKPK